MRLFLEIFSFIGWPLGPLSMICDCISVHRFGVQRFKGWRNMNTGRFENIGAVGSGIFPGSKLSGTMV